MPFKPAPRVTEAGKQNVSTLQVFIHLHGASKKSDEKNDRRSMDRRLQDSLFLIVKRNRNDKAWQFPQGKFLEEDTHMRGVRYTTPPSYSIN